MDESRLLEGSVRSAVFWLAMPALGEQLLNSGVTWFDAFLAGRISAEATGAIGVAGYVGWLMTMLFGLVSIGATAIVARAIGSKRPTEAERTTNQAFVLAVILGLMGTVFVQAAAPLFARILNMKGQAATVAVTYMRIDSVGFVGASVSFALAACLRGAGNTRTPMVIFGGVNVFNIILSWFLTFGLGPFAGLGVDGIACGTASARWLGAIWIFVVLQRGKQGLRLRASRMLPDRELIGRVLHVGVPAAVDGALMFAGQYAFMAILTRIPTAFPETVLYAAHIIGVRIESLSYLPANAWSVAASTMVGQNLGARQVDRARRAAHEAVFQAALLLAGSGLLYFFGAEALFRLLSADPQVWKCGVPALKWLALFQMTLAPLIVYLGALRGAGDTRVPMIITFVGLALVRLPVAALGGFYLQGGLLGAWMGMFADLVVRTLLMLWRFQTGRWQKIKV